MVVDGLRVTSIERTLLDLASIGVDVDRLAHEALAKRLTTQTKLRATANDHRGRRGARQLLAIAGAPHVRSDLERKFLRFLDDHGLPRPLMNHNLGRYTPDGVYEDEKLIIELDEDGHKSTWAFEEDRQRDRHHATLGYTTIRVTERSLTKELAVQLRAIVSP